MVPIRGPHEVDAQQREDIWTRRSQHPDPPVDVMPALRKPEPGPGLVSEFDPNAASKSVAATAKDVRKTAKTSRESPREPARLTFTVPCAASSGRERISPAKVTVTGAVQAATRDP